MKSFERFPTYLLCLGLFLGTPASAQDTPRGFQGSTNAHIEKWAYILSTSVWRDTTIYVCWEGSPDGFKDETKWVEAAIGATWQTASALQFKGWGPCAERTEGIRIQIDDSGPHVKALGRGLDGMNNGMVLNFTFNNWSPVCKSSSEQRKRCIESIAVHEFGHAIGFAHEQNRPDAPGECAVQAQGSNGDTLLTPYDPTSVMNYCNPLYNNDGKLSDLDAKAVKELYPAPTK